MTHNETMFGLIEDIQTAIERAHRVIELHVEENGVLDRFTEEYLTRARDEAVKFSREYNREMSVEARRAADREVVAEVHQIMTTRLAEEHQIMITNSKIVDGMSDKLAKERVRDEVTEDEELAEALDNAPGPLNDRAVLELENDA